MSADEKTYVCQVVKAGAAANGKTYIWLREQSGAFNTWFIAHPATAKEMLATALVAISMGLSVEVVLTATEMNTVLLGIYVFSW
jgi:hypothetical protein